MAIEIGGASPRERKDLTPPIIMPGGGRDWSGIVLNFGLAVLVLVLALGIGVFIRRNLVAQELQGIQGEIASLEAERRTQDAQRFVGIQRELQALRDILANHIYASKLFSWVEGLTHPKVSFSSIDADFKNHTVSLNGLAVSYDVVAQQVKLFEQDEFTADVSTEAIQAKSEGVSFLLKVQFGGNLLKR